MHYVVLYPQNGDRIVTIDSVTSLHPMYGIHNLRSQYHRHFVGILWHHVLRGQDLSCYSNKTESTAFRKCPYMIVNVTKKRT